MTFDWSRLKPEDAKLAENILGFLREPDYIIGDEGKEYLYRWHVIPRGDTGNIYFHIQVSSDPERPLHDHPWDNMSVILAGGYEEMIQNLPWPGGYVTKVQRKKGDVIYRLAEQPHRLLLPPRTPYTMTLFSTGPKRRDWGFWCEIRNQLQWRCWSEVTEELPDGRSVWKEPAG